MTWYKIEKQKAQKGLRKKQVNSPTQIDAQFKTEEAKQTADQAKFTIPLQRSEIATSGKKVKVQETVRSKRKIKSWGEEKAIEHECKGLPRCRWAHTYIQENVIP